MPKYAVLFCHFPSDDRLEVIVDVPDTSYAIEAAREELPSTNVGEVWHWVSTTPVSE